MGKKIVSLVSRQTIPNVEFIKAKKIGADRLVFITTETMEKQKKTDWILKSLGEDNGKRIIVTETSISEIKAKLMQDFIYNKNDEILVNLTGGNKNMFLAAYEFFKEKGLNECADVKMYYLNEGRNKFNMVFPNEQRECINGGYCNLKEYLTAYSIEPKKPGMTPLMKFEKTLEFYKTIFIDKTEKTIINEIHKAVGNNIDNFKELPKELSANMGVRHLFEKVFGDFKEITKPKIRYLTGSWFEEYVYFLIKRGLSLSNEDIYLSLKMEDKSLVGNTADNEIDVIFIYNNKVNIIECKTGHKDGTGKSILQNVLYKQSALQKIFGLTAKSFLFLPDAISGSEHQKERAKVYSIDIVDDMNMLIDEDKFKREFLNKFALL